MRTRCSVISPGTERMKVEQARMSLLDKARARPDQVRKVLDTARTLGWKAAYEKVRNRLESPTPLGYSAAGVVEAVDPLNRRFRVGDRVACGGAECAFHAEVIAVPDLLAAPVPEGVEDWQAAYTTLASIAMEAVRQAAAGIGERALVIGQGLVGLLVTNLLREAGVRVMAVDLEATRLGVAERLGAERVAQPEAGGLEERVREWTEGQGVDQVMICIGGGGGSVAENAIASLREGGVIVVVGMHDLELPWKTAYMKNIQVRYSRSYGPGRYDPSYEWGGNDYPAGRVRWTENRNFEACLHLMRTGALDLAAVTTRRAAFAEALTVYDELTRPGNRDLGVVLEYDGTEAPVADAAGGGKARVEGKAADSREGRGAEKVERVHVIGAGNFARTMLLPHLRGRIALGTVVNGTGMSAEHARTKFGFEAAGTDVEAVFGRRGEAVMIATRHHLHAPLVLRGLRAGQQVFVEKPLCLNEEELAEIDAAMEGTAGGLMVGFNRRFAPATVEAMKRLAGEPGPRSISYHVSAGRLPEGHWSANAEESGGRVIGEACHFFDFFCHVIGSRPVSVSAQPVGTGGGGDAMAAQAGFADGSTAQLIYTEAGDPAFPKESWRVFAGGMVIECEDFQKLAVCRRRRRVTRSFKSKGHAEEMAAWADYLAGGQRHPLPYAEARRSMALTFAAVRAARENRVVKVEGI